MTDQEIIDKLKDAVRRERHSTAEVLEHLAAFDERKLWRDEGYPHLFAYCREALGYSESAAGKRIFACRAAQKHRRIFTLLHEGKLHLEGILILATSLTPQNRDELLSLASGKSAREIQKLVAQIKPAAPKPDLVRTLPPLQPPALAPAAPSPASAGPIPPSPALSETSPPPRRFDHRIEPSAPNRSRIYFDADDDVVALIERARQVMRHKYPFAVIADIVREALNALLDERDPERALALGGSARPAVRRPISAASENRRRIPRWVRIAVWKRDEGRCAFVSDEGRRCGTRGWLEYDHVLPFAKGGRSDDPGNVRLLCRHHNQLMAERHFNGGCQDLPLR